MSYPRHYNLERWLTSNFMALHKLIRDYRKIEYIILKRFYKKTYILNHVIIISRHHEKGILHFTFSLLLKDNL
jgi:hypothetical protein